MAIEPHGRTAWHRPACDAIVLSVAVRVCLFSFVLVVGCGGAAQEPPRAADEVVARDSEAPVEAARTEGAETSGVQAREEALAAEPSSVVAEPVTTRAGDELQGLESEDLSGHQAATEADSETPGVARGRSGGQLDTRRVGVHVGHRRARTAVHPLDDEAVDAVINEHVAEAHYCYRRAFGERPDVHGRVEIEASVAPDGRVSEAHVSHSTIRNEQVDDCILEAFRRWRFPTAESATHVEHSFRLGTQ